MTSNTVTAAAAGTWKLGDLTVNRMGFGAMRLPQTGRVFAANAVPGDRGNAITVPAGTLERCASPSGSGLAPRAPVWAASTMAR
jgi:hypothetical protein